jgi:hypothetical protein
MKLLAIGSRQLDSRHERAKMIRSLATVMCFGALAGAAVFWAAVKWSQHPLVVWIGERHQAGKAFPAGELPRCTAMGSLAADVDWAPLDPDFAAGKKALAAEDWTAAIAALKLAAVREPDNADVQNYIGYAYRRLRQMEQAFGHYSKAVALNPRHRSAHQHLGEAFLLKGEISKAEEHLAALERICLIAPKDTLRETHEPTFEAVEHLAGRAANGSLERRLADLEISVRKLKVSVERLCSWTKRSDGATRDIASKGRPGLHRQEDRGERVLDRDEDRTDNAAPLAARGCGTIPLMTARGSLPLPQLGTVSTKRARSSGPSGAACRPTAKASSSTLTFARL